MCEYVAARVRYLSPSNEERLYALHDASGNVTAIADEEANIKERFLYDAFGKPMFLNQAFEPYSAATFPPGDVTRSNFDWEYLYGTLRYDRATGLYFDGSSYYHPRLGRTIPTGPIGVTAESRLNGYAASFPLVAPPVPGGSLEEFHRWWAERTPEEQMAIIGGAVVVGVAVVGLTVASGGTALPALGASAAAFFGAGALVGGVHGFAETYAADPDASLGHAAVGGGLGAVFGALNPVGEFASAGSAVAGGAIEKMNGGDFLGQGFQIGGLAGGVVGGFGTAARGALRQGANYASRRVAIAAAARAGARNVRWEAAGIVAGAGIGSYAAFRRNGSVTLADAYHGATWGMMAAGAARGLSSFHNKAIGDDRILGRRIIDRTAGPTQGDSLAETIVGEWLFVSYSGKAGRALSLIGIRSPVATNVTIRLRKPLDRATWRNYVRPHEGTHVALARHSVWREMSYLADPKIGARWWRPGTHFVAQFIEEARAYGKGSPFGPKKVARPFAALSSLTPTAKKDAMWAAAGALGVWLTYSLMHRDD